jgi:hypothetical protein
MQTLSTVIKICDINKAHFGTRHEGIAGNEMADHLARTGSEHPLTGLEPDCSISIEDAKKAVRDWTNRNHKEYWEPTTGLKKAKGLIPGPSA